MSTSVFQKGFTLVETLVAITVLLLVIIGPITVAQKGIQSAYYANEQVTAVFLAQEAVEAIRHLRDSEALKEYGDTGPGDTWDWLGALDVDCTDGTNVVESTGCAYDADSGTFESCTANNGCELYVDPSTFRYSYDNNDDPSGFTRKVYVNDTNPDAIAVRVIVTWESSIFSASPLRSMALETWLYDHYARYGE